MAALKAVQQLTVAPQDSDYEWYSTGDDPQFVLSKRLPLPGWQMLEISLNHNQPTASVRIYLDFGEGFIEEQSVYLPIKPGRVTKRLFYVPRMLRALRFDPMEHRGQFTIAHMRIVWLMPWFAHDRLVHRLVNMHYRWRLLSKSEILPALKSEARKTGRHWRDLALSYYEATFERFTMERYYQRWVESRHELSGSDIHRALENIHFQPLISILLPVYDAHPERLQECINSVLAQSYPHWELCIALEPSTEEDARTLLSEYAKQDKRIHVVISELSGGICALSNSALELASGEFVTHLWYGDRLAPNALFHIIEALRHHPNAKVLYSDEDKLSADGNRVQPHFKPQWNPELLLSHNYISNLAVYRTQLVREIGGYREDFEGGEDYDLALRCTAMLSPEHIVHIPLVLYHSRVDKYSFCHEYANEAGLRAVRAHLAQYSLGAEVHPGLMPNTYRICWPLPNPAPLVSLLVPTRDRIEILRPCVEAVLGRTDYPNLELIILDNGSKCPEMLAFIEKVASQDSRVRIVRWDFPFNYSAINNYGARLARGEILGLINNDIEPINVDWLSEMVRHACRPEVGCVGAKLYYPNGMIQHGGVILGLGGVAGHAHRGFMRYEDGYCGRLKVIQNFSAVTAACLLLKKSIFDEVGGLNEDDLPVAFNDVDLCLKVREAGYRNLWTPYAELYHHESVTRGADNNSRKRARAAREVEYMRRTWGKELDNDPAYNRSLTLVYEDFSLR